VPQANLNWWYPATYTHNLGTLVEYKANFTDGLTYATLVPAIATFDVSRTVNDEVAVTPSSTYDPLYDVFYTNFVEYTVKPSAQSTFVITRTAALPLPSGNIFPADDVRLYDVDPVNLAPASIELPAAAGNEFVATSATPFVYFSAYEVETSVPVTPKNGKVTYETSTQTFDLGGVYAYPVGQKGLENLPVLSGNVPVEFLGQIPQSSCCVGTYTAVVTVLIVVDITYWEEIGTHGDPFRVHIESSVLDFSDEPPATPLGRKPDPGPQTPAGMTTSALEKVHVENSAAPTGFEDPSTETVRVENSASPTGFESNRNAGNPIPPGPAATEPSYQSIGSVGSKPINLGPSSVILVGSQTLQPGSAITVAGTPIYLAPSATAIVIGDSTSVLPHITSDSPPPPILTIGSSTFTGNAATQYLVGSAQILTPGGTATVGGTVVRLGPSASFIVVGESTQTLHVAAPGVTAAAQIIVGGQTVTANPGGSPFVVNGQTLNPGQAITFDGTTVSLDRAASSVAINGVTQPVLVRPVNPSAVLTFGNSQITANSGSTFVIGGQTLVPGGTVMVSGTTIALGPSASFVVVNGATSTFANPAARTTPPPLSIGDGVFSALSGSGTTYIIDGQTLTPGGTITVASSTISLAPGASALIINGKSTTLLSPATITNPPLLTIGSQTITALPGGGTTFVIGDRTLTPGGVITVDGTTISLAPGATMLTYGSQGRSTTTTLFPATTTRGQSVTESGASAGATRTNSARQTKSMGAGGSTYTMPYASWMLSVFLGMLGLMIR
jgi:hypothetical protein